MTVCTKTQWPTQGRGGLSTSLPAALFLSTAATLVGFVCKTRLWRHVTMTTDDLHSIETHASCMVHVSKTNGWWCAIERSLVVVAMYIDVAAFSALPLQLIGFEVSGMLLWPPPWMPLVSVVAASTALLVMTWLALVLPRRLRDPVRRHLLLPLLADSTYMLSISSLAHVSICGYSNRPVTFVVVDASSSCACPDRTFVYATAGNVCLVAWVYTALHYKHTLRRHQLPAIRFGYSAAHSILITAVRTIVPLVHTTAVSLLVDGRDIVSRRTLVVGLGAGQSVVVAVLLAHHYLVQPCHGAGFAWNNLRAVALGLSLHLSIVAVAVGLAPATFHTSFVAWLVAVCPVPATIVAAWLLNGRRAALFAIPQLSPAAALDAPSVRVKATAARALSLGPLGRLPRDDLLCMLPKLLFFQTVPLDLLDGRVIAYTLDAVWKIAHHVYDLRGVVVVPDVPIDDDRRYRRLAPPHLWPSRRPDVTIPHKHTSDTKPSPSRDTHAAIQLAFDYAVALTQLPFPAARCVVARVLQEMYVAGVARLPLCTLVSVACTLCGSDDDDANLQHAGAATLARLGDVYSPHDDLVPILLSDDVDGADALVSLLRFLASSSSVVGTSQPATAVAHLVRLVAKHMLDASAATSPVDPADLLSPEWPSLLAAAWRQWQHRHYFVATALEDICVDVDKAVETYQAVHAARRALNLVTPLRQPSSSSQATSRRQKPHRQRPRTTYIEASMWREVQARQAMRDDFAEMVQTLLVDGGRALSPAGRAALATVLHMLATAPPLLLLGHLHDVFSYDQVAHVRHLQLMAELTNGRSLGRDTKT
ncbi:Aste57867_23941 [Aphanomyces stellatus]|uniref:Aste57867_23941 protein n=1 Tax=Aphanomyces stellatus TaxID=120398 RepID=A0A485LPU1_9STRA|nr:hypothetical protein As57867_023868 [Aphanomyces stellatus]VFU00584.1 Aste57867_23941 [Aphanomyces stellatus]